MHERNYFGSAMVDTGDADAMISGMTRNYATAIKPALQVIGVEEGVSKIAGMYIMMTKDGPIFFADTTVNVDPNAREIADITKLVAKAVRKLNIIPSVALLSYSNFGSSEGPDPIKMREAAKLIKAEEKALIIDGEIQANFALNTEMVNDFFSFSELAKMSANTLIFPNLSSGNIAYKLIQEMAPVEAIGPILLGMKKPVHVLQIGSSVREILNMVSIAVTDAQKV